jgi:aryl-alcohol dehydrogenase-like predicted oxidoreductase
MDTRRIGSLEVSVVGLGCNNFGTRVDAAGTKAVVDAAFDAGITFFDTADIYGDTHSEEFLGAALGSRRDQVVVATKFGVPYGDVTGGASPEYVRQAVDASLRRLGTDHIDLYQLHFPDRDVPLGETLGALHELVVEGKVRHVGCSNFSASLLSKAEAAAEIAGSKFASVQNQYNLLHREPEAEVLPWCAAHDTAFLPYFPLASGLLTGKYRAGEAPPEGARLSNLDPERAAQTLGDESLGKVAGLEALAAESGHSVLDLAVSWLLSHEVVASVLSGATRPEQVRANAAAGAWSLPADVVARVDELAPVS